MKAHLSTWSFAILVCASVALGGANAYAQGGLTGQISGTVVDNTKAVLPGVTVSVRNANTGVSREAVTDGTGAFVVTNLLAGTYDVKASLTGFKAYEQKGLTLLAQQRLAMPAIVLEVGGMSETVSVEGVAPQVQTTSGERSATITSEQMLDIGLKGRNFMAALATLPGVVDTGARERDAPGWGSVGGVTINGQTSFNFSYDGIVSKDTGSNSGNYAAPGLDSIAEVKVQSSNFQAEYGRSSGASITVITKSGTKSFKGSLAYFKRDEAFNANTWARRRNCDAAPVNPLSGLANPNCEKPPYKFNNTAWTIGGPIKLPGGRLKDKLFFFFSEDLLPRLDPGTLRSQTMPTALERAGDFSQTVNTSGQRIWIKDPLLAAQGLTCSSSTGGAGCFPNNIIDPKRIDPIGQKMLGLFPLPNTVDPTGRRQFNYQIQLPTQRPRNDQVARIDWNVAPNTTFYSRFQFGHEVNSRGYSAGLGGNTNWPQLFNSYEIQTYSTVNTLLHTFSPTTVLEVTIGENWSHQYNYPYSQETLDANDRTKVLPGFAQFFPQSNPMNLIPSISFATGNPNPPNITSTSFESRYPFFGYNKTFDATSNLTKVIGKHNMKAGIFIEFNARPAARSSSFNGSLSFVPSSTNPYDSNYGYANAILGSINSYTESTAHPWADGRYRQVEFFVQDNWRLARRFTIDGGLRFYAVGPTFVKGQKVAYFDPSLYDPTKAVKLYEPVCPGSAATCSATARLAKNPLTGQLLNNTYVGKLVPNSGDPYNGMRVVDGTPYDWWGVKPAGRIGFAWDVAGNGKTAVRGGFGTFFDRYSDDTILSLVEQPPLLDTFTTNFTTIPLLLGSQLIASPRGVSQFDPGNFHPPTVHNWSLGMQRELPFKFTGDVAYVGNIRRYGSTTRAMNNFGYGTTRVDLNPQNIDPTNCQSGGCSAKGSDYLRARIGFAGISLRRWATAANYHSVQFSISRRLQHGFAFTVAYTGSTSHSQGEPDQFLCPLGKTTCTPEENLAANRARNYTASGSRPHNLVINYNYLVPDASKLLGGAGDNLIVRGILNGWQISGVTTMQSGTRGGFDYSFANGTTPTGFGDGTGGPGGSRVAMLCDPFIPKSERTTDRQFKTECISPPGPVFWDARDIYYLGNGHNDEWVSLGYMNHDLTVFKNFRMARGRTLQIRIEGYNPFNKTQYNDVGTSATFDFVTGAQTAADFGKITGARNNPRILQLGARFTF